MLRLCLRLLALARRIRFCIGLHIVIKTTLSLTAVQTAPCVLRPRGCVALIARDPRELVVSGFLYHRNGAPDNKYDQSWLNASMWSDAEAAASIRPPTVLPLPHVRFAAQALRMT